jgi:hypothetical protein
MKAYKNIQSSHFWICTCLSPQDAPEEAVCHCMQSCILQSVHIRHLTQSDDTICPTPGCKNHLKDDSVFSLIALKHCTSDDNVNNEISTSLGGVNELDLKFDNPGFNSSKIKATMETLQALSKLGTSASSNSSVSNINKGSGIKAEVDV